VSRVSAVVTVSSFRSGRARSKQAKDAGRPRTRRYGAD
jgi:hypothetical protein